MSFPVVELSGSPHEMGLAHGRALGRAIKANLELYAGMFQSGAGLPWPRALARAAALGREIEAAAPRLMDEMRGVAAGAGVGLEEILVLNCRTEIAAAGPECTALGLTGRRTASGRAIIAQNWDWRPELKWSAALFRLRPAGRPAALTFAEAGQLAKIGLNENGLGVLLNILLAERGFAAGLPVHVLLRLVLEAETLAGAVDAARKARRAGASHFLLGWDDGAAGQVLGLEICPGGAVEIAPRDDVVIHTNHFLSPGEAGRDLGPAILPDSLARLERAAELMAQRRHWDEAGLEGLLSDERGLPGAISRQVDPAAPGHLRFESVGSFILDLSGRAIRACWGRPRPGAYHAHTL